MIKKHPRLVCSWTDYWGLTQYPPIKAQEREPQRVPVYSICAHQCLSSKAQALSAATEQFRRGISTVMKTAVANTYALFSVHQALSCTCDSRNFTTSPSFTEEKLTSGLVNAQSKSTQTDKWQGQDLNLAGWLWIHLHIVIWDNRPSLHVSEDSRLTATSSTGKGPSKKDSTSCFFICGRDPPPYIFRG